MRLSHNMFSEGIYKNYKRTLVQNSKAMNNIGSGLKLNSAKDNPGKIAEAGNIKISLLSRDAASQNIQDTNSMLQTFDGALQEMNNNVTRLKELSVKAATGTTRPEDRQIIQTEIDKIKEDLDYLAKNTKFNGIAMSNSGATLAQDPTLVASPSALTAKLPLDNQTPVNRQSTIGALPDQSIDVPFYNLTNTATGIANIDVTNTTKLQTNIDWTDYAGKLISSARSKYGAIQSRLNDTLDDISGMNLSLTSAQSSIEDADIAEESLQLSRTQVIYQASIALMAQSNKLPQNALNVLASVR
ncbi:flagellin [Clostridium saccharoperbutylacetonicum]